ncbi:hypothetical protein T08_10577 [Trichinella sp. T8]|nr:hypothetical protein T08_10577 [Trichinella sp. T8]
MAVLMIQKKMRRVHFRLLCSMRYRAASMLFRSMPPHIHVVIFYGAAQIKATNDRKVTRGLASDSDYVEVSKDDVQLPLKPIVSKLIQRVLSNRCGGLSLVFEGRAYKLKHTRKQKKYCVVVPKSVICINLEVADAISKKEHVDSGYY